VSDRTEQAQAKQQGVLEDFILDPWTSLSFKRALGDRRMAGVSWTVAGWAGQDNVRRLMAYKLRHAYYENAARHFLPTVDAKKRSDHREYGDAALITETVRSALLGDEQTLHIDGADEFDPDEAADAGTPADNPDEQAQNRRAATLLDQLEDWIDKETFPLKLIEVERNACKLGDGVYVLGWSQDKLRVRLRVYDPGFYFPVLESRGDEDFPQRVHVAWELDNDDVANPGTKVHRITWELRTVAPYALPWNERPATVACFMSEGVWTLDQGSEATVDNFTEANVEWLKTEDGADFQNINIGVDFIPVIHVSNTVAYEAHFGASVIDKVLQILDDLSQADTDLQTAAMLAGFPPIAVGKTRLDTDPNDERGVNVVTYGPGTAFEVGDGNLTALDMSGGVRALIDYVNHLLERLETNARVPAGILGRIKPSEVPSGIALALSFGPLQSMINEMRLVRREKYRLLFRFVTRFMWVNDVLDEEPPDAEPELLFGSFMQTDMGALVTQVAQLLAAHAVSTPTALAMLIEGGLPIEDAAEELAAIHAEDFEAANQLLDATDDPQLVRDWLGIEGAPPPPPPAPEPVVPIPPEVPAPAAPPG
jgi:hypothetical protein